MPTSLPNLLTLSRILATPVVCVLLLAGGAWGAWLALVVYISACVTDFLDGYLARRTRQQSSFGRVLDPIADKLLVGAVLLVLVGIDHLAGVHIVAALIILCREILVSGLREHLAAVNVGVPVTRLAKWKTTLQMIAIGFLVVGDHGPVFGPVTTLQIGLGGIWLAAVLTLVTGYDYLRASLGYLGVNVGCGATRGIEPADTARDTG